jgi:hypothetical protein
VTRRITALAAVGLLGLISWLAGYWVLSSRAARTSPVALEQPATTASVSVASQTDRPDPMMAKVLSPRRSKDDFHAGVGVMLYDNDPAFSAKAGVLLDRLARLGVNSVSLAFPIFQDSWTATELRTNDRTPTDENLRDFVNQAHKRDFTVMFRPLLDEASLHRDKRWRGELNPTDPGAWFRSYSALLDRYGRLGQAVNVDSIDIGTEFVSLEKYTSEWLKVIASLRQNYSGQLTYSANWDRPFPGFGQALDFLGIDAFYPLAATDSQVSRLVGAWDPWLKLAAQIERTNHKPVVFTELGTTSETDSFKTPWIWRHETGVDMEAQRVYYAASCQAAKSRVHGMYWWVFELVPLANPTKDPGFSPSGKPAELEIERCFR